MVESEEKIFELDSKTDIGDWEYKQTPDLGEKTSTPDYLQDHFRNLKAEKVQVDEIDLKEDCENGFQFTCQKVLFN